MTLDNWFQLGTMVVMAGGVLYIRKLVRFVVIQKDFPPHRHLNGSSSDILYPDGFQPPPIQHLGRS